MLKQYGHKSLKRAERRTVYHNRTMLLVVASDILEIETLRKIVINLDCSELPFPADCILHHEIQLRAIESSLTILYNGIKAFLLCSLDNCSLSLLPVLIRSYVFCLVVRVTQGHLCNILAEIKGLENIENNVNHFAELLFQLIRTAEKMRVILCKAAHACKSVKLTALFIAVNGSELCKPERQVLI